MYAPPWAWLESRGGDVWNSQTSSASLDSNSGTTQGFQFQDNSTTAFINKVRFDAARSLRRSLIILAAFNVLVALLTAIGVFWDCYRSKKRRCPGLKTRSLFWNVIGPAEIYPFILSCGIIVQGIGFAVLQAEGLKALLILGCVPISQLMLPTFFITPYIQFAFGMETTIRAVWPSGPFPKRPKWVAFGSLAIVVAGLIATYVVTRFTLPPNFCFAALFWLIQRWSLGCVIVLTGIISALALGCGITLFQLHRSTGVKSTEWLAGYGMVHYMALAVMHSAIMVPFFYSITFGDDRNPTSRRIQLSMAASIVANLTGFTNAGLYIFLRYKMKATGLEGYFEFGRNRARNGFWSWAPSNRTYTRQMELPVSPVRSIQRRPDYRFQEAEGDFAENKTEFGWSSPATEAPTHRGFDQVQSSPETLARPEAAWMAADQGRKARNESYSIFPQKQGAPDSDLASPLPVVTYTPALHPRASTVIAYPSVLIPAPPAAPSLLSVDHRRGSSLGSSATVQIGMRLSNLDRVSQPHRASSLKETNSIYSARYGASNVPRTASALTTGTITLQYGGSIYNDSTDKALPPVPLGAATPTASAERDKGITLSPTVYSPQEKAQRRHSAKPLMGSEHNGLVSNGRRDSALEFDADMAEWI